MGNTTFWCRARYDHSCKGIANGMLLAAVVTTKDIADTLQKNTISTFGGNPVSLQLQMLL